MDCNVQATAFRSSKEATGDEKTNGVLRRKILWVLQCVKQEKKYLK